MNYSEDTNKVPLLKSENSDKKVVEQTNRNITSIGKNLIFL